MNPLKPLSAALAAVLYLTSLPSMAYDERIVLAPNGNEVFRLRFYSMGDGQYMNPEPDMTGESTWNLSERQKHNITAAASYWAEIIQPVPGSSPPVVNIGTVDDENAFGTGIFLTDDELLYTGLQAAFQTDEAVPDDLLNRGSHGQFVMGRLDYAEGQYLPSQIGVQGAWDITAVAVHELAHSLGALNLADDIIDGRATPYFNDTLDVWSKHLVDDNGNPARPGQTILCADCDNPYDPNAFDARLDRARFVGPNVLDALEGGLPGVPVKMMSEILSGATVVDGDYMSHIELRNSLMSHQSYRNYAQFMEAELAIVQDLGYTVDRRNFFGRSVYGSGLSIVNDRGFYARNEAGTAYVPGQYNTATVGLGLHVYGSSNHVRQTADLLSAGAGGAGIRVDGEGNTVVVDPGVRIHALGLNGQGVMFTYGKGHQLVHRGEIRATGDLGVGLRVDFGHNLLGDALDYRGSYIRTSEWDSTSMPAELQGPLVDRADITGSIVGSQAALYMSPNALVDRVNIMQGARIEGDIVSEYAQRDEAGRLRLTTLSFGQKANSVGRATGMADPEFTMHYADDIRGRNNLHVILDGGTTVLDGRNDLHGMTIRPSAALGGNGRYAISPEGVLRNEGRVDPGYPVASHAVAAGGVAGDAIGRIEIDGNFEQTATGVLAADFTPMGAHDTLAVTGTASLDGTLALDAMPGWYASDWTLDASVVEAARTEGEFNTISSTLVSPSLEFVANPLGEGHYRVAARRGPDAYSRHAENDNGRNAGEALQRAASALGAASSLAASPDQAAFSEFVTALDFSALDGSGVRHALSQISPAAYSAGVSASLHRERDVMDVALQGLRAPALGGAEGNRAVGSWRGFASVFGGKADQDQHGNATGYDVSTYGLVVGGTQRLAANPAVRVGGHLDIAHQSYSPDAPLSGKGRTTSFGLGLQAGYAPNEDEGVYAWSGLRFGIEDASMKRQVSTVGHAASHSADWTGRSASAVVGSGYRWKLAPGVSAGPVASVNYAVVSRPDINESGHAATRLGLDSERFDALRSSLGVAAHGTWDVRSDSTVSAHAQATWDREWMDREAGQTASFIAVPSVTFTSRNQVVPKDSLGLQVGLDYRHDARMTVGAAVSGRFGGGYDERHGPCCEHKT